MKVSVVTGAAQGIGLGIARRLAAIGHKVVLLDRDEARLAEVSGAIEGEVRALAVDIADEAGVREAFARIEAECGAVQILVNNAGICPAHEGRSLPIEEMALDEWRQVLDVNLTGTFLCCRAALPGMKAGGWGRIINFSSMGGRMRSLLSGAHYATTKAGVIGFTRVLAGQVGGHGITANCIAPGRIDTQQSQSFGNVEPFLAQLPLGRIGDVDDIAAGVEYLVSDGAAYVTGTVLDINGGHYMP
jgi:NAD(P)-dependent dehydrogenase (short-subunit alcohol dehydrogenase family)